ncbi:MAG TPA: PEP-CTERM sorting domain-containing protein [Stellaceae bacterium]|nr:PEP-CTERM sorting domain-containing protein [Stellaceae bacterium]
MRVADCLKIAVVAALVTMPFSTAFAVTVTSTNPDWLLVTGSVGANTGIFALPATIPGCGSENEPNCEPTGNFVFSQSLKIAGPSFYTITDSDGGAATVSDIITIANSGPGGTGVIQFFSDPNVPTLPTGFASLGALCDEGSAGCSGLFTVTTSDNTVVTVEPASDSESFFNPFGFSFDSSDQIRFTGVTTIAAVPEPSSLALLLAGLAGLGYGVRRRARRQV